DTTNSPTTSKYSLKPLSSYNSIAKSPTPDSVFDQIPVSQAYDEGVPGYDVDTSSPVPASETTGSTGATTAPAVAAGGTIKIACPPGVNYRTFNIVAVSAAEVL